MIKNFLKLTATVTSRGGSGNGRRLLVMIYHRVLEQPDPLAPGEPTREQFDWQMRLLSSYFNVLPLELALEQQSRGELPPRAVAITFDDGYADNYHVALPVLEKYGLNATFFIAAGYLDGGRMWNDSVIETVRLAEQGSLDLSAQDLGVHPVTSDAEKRACISTLLTGIKHREPLERERLTEAITATSAGSLPSDLMMTSDELRALSKRGMAIGGHTISHPILASLDEQQSFSEIAGGKTSLEKTIDREINLFAYPNGKPGADYQAKDVACVEKAGFKAAVSTQWGVSDGSSDRFQLPRFTPWDATPDKFMARLALTYRNLAEAE